MYNFLFIILYCLMMATLRQPKHVAVICKNKCCVFNCLSVHISI
jgi:hypothetical protein